MAAVTPIHVTVAGSRPGLAAALGWPWPRAVDVAAGLLLALAIGVAGWHSLGLRLVIERRPGA